MGVYVWITSRLWFSVEVDSNIFYILYYDIRVRIMCGDKPRIAFENAVALITGCWRAGWNMRTFDKFLLMPVDGPEPIHLIIRFRFWLMIFKPFCGWQIVFLYSVAFCCLQRMPAPVRMRRTSKFLLDVSYKISGLEECGKWMVENDETKANVILDD